MQKTLFISVDGQQIYLESLFLPILASLNSNKSIEILQFCLDDKELKNNLLKSCEEKNIKIHFGKYFNNPPIVGSFLFILAGSIKLYFIIKKQDIKILMPRSLVAGSMVLLIKPFFKDIKIIYESDGLIADERVDFGGWSKSGFIYKLFRKIEKKLIYISVAITTRTQKAKNILIDRTNIRNREKIFVVPNAKKLVHIRERDKQRKEIRNKLRIFDDDIVFIYIGSIGKQYEPNKILAIYDYIHSKINNSKMIILTPNINEINEILSKFPNISLNIFVDSVHSSEINRYILSSDIGLSLRTPSFSQQGICPLKLIEYLMMGIPVISNKGIGDLDDLYENYDVGYIIDDLNSIKYEEILNFVKNIKKHSKYNSENISLIAKKEFNIKDMIKKYRFIFNKVSSNV